MENRINIATLLKNCSSGMELDCTMFDNVTLEYVAESSLYPIRVRREDGNCIALTKYGQFINADFAKCVIFPKGKTTWKGFVPPCQFKNGDVVATSSGAWIGITTGGESGELIPTYCVIKGNDGFEAYTDVKKTWCFSRFATKEERQKLFDEIKAHGYTWNSETKTLEKLVVPEFKVGDKITNGKTSITIGYIDDEYYYEVGRNIATRLFIKNQDEWNLIPNKFDINTLKPFDSRVLVRDYSYEIWRVSFWGCLINSEHGFKYDTIRGPYKQCIPYEGNEYLLGKTASCNDFYKTWE